MLGVDRAAPIKRTAVERQVNVQIVFLFIVLLALSLASTIGSSIRQVSCFLLSGLISSLNKYRGIVVLCAETVVFVQYRVRWGKRCAYSWFRFGDWANGESSFVAKGFIEDILTFVILYNNLIPISYVPHASHSTQH
jgi:phospholipid-transporting ATPase